MVTTSWKPDSSTFQSISGGDAEVHDAGCACAACCSEGGHTVDDGHDHGSWIDFFGLGSGQPHENQDVGFGGRFGGFRSNFDTPISYDGGAFNAFEYGVTVVDNVGGTSAAVLQIFETLTEIALNTWGKFLGSAPGASLEVQVNVGGTTAVASAGPGAIYVDSYEDNNNNGQFDFGDVGTLIAGSLLELLTGVDENGAEADIIVNVNPAFINSGQFFYDTTVSQTVPANQIDFYSVILHELGHGLGFFGLKEAGEQDVPLLNFGSFVAQGGMLYDFLIDYIDGRPYFVGENAMALYGGPVPLEDNQGPGSDISHFLGTEPTNQGGINLQWALMNPFVINGDRVSIGDLELAVFEDIGAAITMEAGFLINGPGDEGQAVTGNMGGGDDDMFLQGDGDPNDLMGGDGNDTLEGRNGDDTLDGGAGDDSLVGGNDDDSLIGGADDDTLIGNKGNDTMEGGSGADTLFGGLGEDSLEGGSGSDTVDGGADDDVVDGGDGDDTVRGQKGNDTVLGGDGDDLVEGRIGNDSVEGGMGDDTVVGNAGSDTLRGGDGNDRLNGGKGNDFLFAEAGTDRMTGGDGADMFDVIGAERAIIVDINFDQGDSIVFFDATITTEEELLDYIADNSLTVTQTGNEGNNLTIEYGLGQELVLQGEGDLIA